jgi:hypothetical protein
MTSKSRNSAKSTKAAKKRAGGKNQPRRSRVLSLAVDVVVLAIDSNYETVTRIGFDYRQQNVYPYFEARGFTITRCQGSLARRDYVAPEARKANVDYLTGIGHGGYDVYTGDYYNPIFSVGNYSQEEAQGKIVHFVSCETARDLGTDFVLHGCRAYFGYDENFSFQADDANIFFECDSEIDRAFADGLTAAQVYQRVKALFDRRINEFRANGQVYKAATLEFNRDHLRAPFSGPQWGDPQARLS